MSWACLGELGSVPGGPTDLQVTACFLWLLCGLGSPPHGKRDEWLTEGKSAHCPASHTRWASCLHFQSVLEPGLGSKVAIHGSPDEYPGVPPGYNIPFPTPVSLGSETGEVLHPLFIHRYLVPPTMQHSERELGHQSEVPKMEYLGPGMWEPLCLVSEAVTQPAGEKASWLEDLGTISH